MKPTPMNANKNRKYMETNQCKLCRNDTLGIATPER